MREAEIGTLLARMRLVVCISVQAFCLSMTPFWWCRLLELASAVQMWGLLFSGRQAWPYTEQWCEFLDEKHARPINSDTWRQLLQFKKVRRHEICGHLFELIRRTRARFTEHVQQAQYSMHLCAAKHSCTHCECIVGHSICLSAFRGRTSLVSKNFRVGHIHRSTSEQLIAASTVPAKLPGSHTGSADEDVSGLESRHTV